MPVLILIINPIHRDNTVPSTLPACTWWKDAERGPRATCCIALEYLCVASFVQCVPYCRGDVGAQSRWDRLSVHTSHGDWGSNIGIFRRLEYSILYILRGALKLSFFACLSRVSLPLKQMFEAV